MARGHKKPLGPKPRSTDDWRVALASDDEAEVVSALHYACPCSGDRSLYEEFMGVLGRFKKDPRPAVRATAIHLERDAMEQLAMDDRRAEGRLPPLQDDHPHRLS